MQVPQKIKKSHLWVLSKRTEKQGLKEKNKIKKNKKGRDLALCTPIFTAASFTTAKRWKQSKCLLKNE